MKFSAAKTLLINLFAEAETYVLAEDDGVELTMRVTQAGEVDLLLVVNLLYERKRSHVRLAWGLYLYCPRLLTFAEDEATIESMPEAMRLKVAALRSRLSGRVALPTPDAGGVALRASDSVDEWSEEEVIDYVLTALAVSQELAASPLPASSAEELLAWARERESQNGVQTHLRISHTWRVAPGAVHRSARASAA